MGLVRQLWQKGGEQPVVLESQDKVVGRATEGAVPLLNYLLEQWAYDIEADNKPRVKGALSALLARTLLTTGGANNKPLFETEDAAKDWLAAFGAWCLRFQVRQERDAGRVTPLAAPGRAGDPVRRAALAWHTTCEILELMPPVVLCPRSERWLPASGLLPSDCPGDLALEAALRVVDAVERAASGRGYEVLFPTFLSYPDQTLKEPGPIFVARMTALLPNRIGGSLPAVLLAPWSAWSLTTAGRTRISNLLRDPVVRHILGIASSPVALLLELEPAELCAGGAPDRRLSSQQPEGRGLELPTLRASARPVTGVQIHEQSHNLAHLIAAWAASNQRSLRRICASCWVQEETVELNTVDGHQHKLKALRALAEDRQQDVLFLVHHDQAVDLIRLAGPRVLINGRRKPCDVTVTMLADLFEHPDLLTDSFDEYRRALADLQDSERYLDPRYEPDDKKELDAIVPTAPLDRKGVIHPERPFFTCLFGTSPWGPAIYLLTALAKGIEGRDEKELGTAAELRVPLPLLLSRLGNGGEPADEVLAAIRAGLDTLKKLLGCDLFINDLTLRNTVCFDRDKLLLLVVGEPSEGVASYKAGPLRILNEYAGHARSGRPALLFIASDHHHELFLSRQWSIWDKPTTAGPSAHRRG